MDLSERGMKMLFEFEGRHKKISEGRYKAYKCPAGVWTLYAGLTRGIKEGMTCTEAEGERLLRRELVGFEDAVERLVKVKMTQPMFDALVLLAYNIGIGAFEKSTLLKLLNQGKLDQAAAQFQRWNKGGGRVLPGLVKRRRAEAALFLEPEGEILVAKPDVEEEPSMPQAVEVSKVPVIEGAARSPSVWSSLVGLFSTAAGAIWQLGGSVAQETSAEVGAAKGHLTGLEALWSQFGLSLPSVLAVVTFAALGIVLLRHIQRYSEGRG